MLSPLVRLPGMFSHWFAYVMVGTLLAAVAALLAGLVNLGGQAPASGSSRSTALMFARVGLSLLLLVEIIIYLTYIKP